MIFTTAAGRRRVIGHAAQFQERRAGPDVGRDREAPDWQRLYERRERWQIGTVPSGGSFLTAGADVLKDRIEVAVWAWGRALESWLVDHIITEGGPERAES